LWILCALVCAWRCALVFGVGVSEDRTYMGSDTRFDSILFGCALAVGMNPMLDRPVGRPWVWKYLLVPVSLATLLLTFTFREPWFRETVRYTLQGIALTPIFVAAIRFPEWLPFRLLNMRAVAFVGTLSYTLYLSHQIVLMLVHSWRPSIGSGTRALVSLAVAFAISLALYYLVEKPCAQLRKRLARSATPARAAALS
jgi:peptidoglycan/LPS O-acetylase OafA/YrhL